MDAFEISSIEIHADGFNPDDFPRLDSMNSITHAENLIGEAFSEERQAELRVFKETLDSLVPLLEPSATKANDKERVRIIAFQDIHERTVTALRDTATAMFTLSAYMTRNKNARKHLHTLLDDAELRRGGQDTEPNWLAVESAKEGWERAVEESKDVDMDSVMKQLKGMSNEWKTLSQSFRHERDEWQALGKEFATVTEKWQTMASSSKNVALFFIGVAGVAAILILAAPAAGVVFASIASGTALVAAVAVGVFTVSKLLGRKATEEHRKAEMLKESVGTAGEGAEQMACLLGDMADAAENFQQDVDETVKIAGEAREIADSCIMMLVKRFPKADGLVSYLESRQLCVTSTTVKEHQGAFAELEKQVDKFTADLRGMATSLAKARKAIARARKNATAPERQRTGAALDSE